MCPLRALGASLLVGALAAWALVFGQGLLDRKAAIAPAAPVAVRAVMFQACGDTAGVIVVRSDGASAWFVPPFEGLQETIAAVPGDQRIIVNHCPVSPTL